MTGEANPMDDLAARVKNHPAKFNRAILNEIYGILNNGAAELTDRRVQMLNAPLPFRVLDPFGGVGGVHSLARPGAVTAGRLSVAIETYAVELEPEWADVSAEFGWTHQGDFLKFRRGARPSMFTCKREGYWDTPGPDLFDAIVTSPTYGNRMADHHEAKDGSKRLTYRHRLGRALSDNNSGALQWGDEYRKFHWRAWHHAIELLRPGGIFVLNVKDHPRKGERQPVSAWHRKCLKEMGLELEDTIRVPVKGMGFGANQQQGEGKIDHESIYVFRKGTESENGQ